MRKTLELINHFGVKHEMQIYARELGMTKEGQVVLNRIVCCVRKPVSAPL